MWRRIRMPALVALATLVGTPSIAAAHCDSMDGPVVQAAQRALATDNVALVLAWVRAQDETEIREAFARTMRVRRVGGEAAALADYWFFETLVRVHRAGEGAPFTGLKPAGAEAPAGIAAADQALERNNVDALATGLAQHVRTALGERYERVQALAAYDAGDVEAGRRYVHAYVEFIHFVERLHALMAGEAGDPHGDAGAASGEHRS